MMLNFNAKPKTINNQLLLKLPEEISLQLPSRGMVMAEGLLNGKPFTAALEPDGKKGHWMALDHDFSDDRAEVTMSVVSDWHSPELPEDMMQALEQGAYVDFYQSLTPKAQWEWLRWIRSTNNDATRLKRIGIMLDKMARGDRRPCCFDSAKCTVMEVSKAGILLDI